MQPLTGFRDFLPASCAERNYIFANWREVAGRYGFVEFDGPVLEDLDLYKRKSGEEIVSTNTYELASPQEAEEMLRKTLNAPMSVPLQITKLTQLGDEAYMSTGPYSKGETNLLVRKGNYFILMTATSQGLAKRFAKHMVAEIDN